ncbi:MAG TPA: sugar transferase [Candidatus Saccharimonadales bacterium]|nr:sugar transferase [Candidatus Saccharimonadales bacterium]
MKSNASLLYSLCLVVGDYLSVLAAFAAAFYIRGQLSKVPVAHPIKGTTYLGVFLALLPFWILIFGLLGLYGNSIYEKRFRELGRLLVGSFIGLLFVISYGYAVNKLIFPARLVPVYGFALAFVFLVVFRNAARLVRSILFSFNKGITNVLIIGDTKIAQELVNSLADNRVSGYKIIGLVGNKASTAQRYAHLPTFPNLAEAIESLKTSDIHSIVQTELYAAGERNNEILDFAQENHIAYRFVPGNSELFVGNISVELFRGSIPVINVHQTPLIGWGRFIKRSSDLFFGVILLVLSSPLLLIIALAEKLTDPSGPVLYRDQRLTRYGTQIGVFKFRSHKTSFNGLTPEQAFEKMGKPELAREYRKGGDQLANDPRISRIGRVLRRTSLDELPQLFNIVRGDISFVGPRALQVGELDKYAKKDLILAVRSGLTGLAQVSGRRDISFEERRKLDLYYVQNWSLWLDISIVIKTIKAVFKRSGAI